MPGPERTFLVSVGTLALCGLVCFLWRSRKVRLPGPLAVVASAAALGLGVWLYMSVASYHGPVSLVSLGEFPVVGLQRVTLAFQVTRLTGLVNILVLLFGFVAILHSVSYWRDGEQPRFYAFALWAVAGASLATLTRNLLVFLFAWELVTAMLYLLVGVGGERAKAGAAKTFAVLGLGDLALVLAIGLLVARGGWRILDYDALAENSIVVGGWAETGLFLLLVVAAIAKAGAMPLHTWIPAAGDAAPIPTMALLPASLDKLLGIMLLVRASLGFFVLDSYGVRALLMAIGVITIIGAVMMAMVQHDLRRLLSFHAVSQVGYMVLGIGTGSLIGIVGGVFHMINNAVYKSLLFLGAGAVEARTGDLELDNLGGLARPMPLTAASFVVGALAISGIPPLNGFVSKWMVYQGVIEGGKSLMPILLAAAVLGSALTLASFVKAMHGVFLGEASPALSERRVREAGASMLLPMGLLASLCVVLGLGGGAMATGLINALAEEFPAVRGLSEAAAVHAETGAGITSEVGVWGPLPAMGLLALGLVIGLVFYAFGRTVRVRRVRPFICGEQETPAPTHVSGTSFYLTVRELPVVRAVYGDAEREAFDGYRTFGMLGSLVVQGLRRLHTGVLEVYVTWAVVGVAAVVAMLFLLQ
jgi:formate hydrogenlyase subunit 3/multisubunit Na+/H+ antiporter MnhD subunit